MDHHSVNSGRRWRSNGCGIMQRPLSCCFRERRLLHPTEQIRVHLQGEDQAISLESSRKTEIVVVSANYGRRHVDELVNDDDTEISSTGVYTDMPLRHNRRHIEWEAYTTNGCFHRCMDDKAGG